jgi:DNA-binding NtrC family response regulator
MTSDKPNPKRILAIVANGAMAEIIPAMLGYADYKCDSAHEHKAILRMLRRASKYDLVICHVAVLEKEEKFYSWALRTKIPIISFAARPLNGVPEVIRERCIFLQVPFEREQLLAVVRGVFGG